MHLIPLIVRSAKTLYGTFFQGLIVVLPIAITFALLFWLATILEAMLGGLVRLFIPAERYINGFGVLAGIVLIFAAGAMMQMWVTRQLLARAEALMERIPVIKSIYGTIRDLAKVVAKNGKGEQFQKVVTIAISNNIRLMGFVTREDATELSDGSGIPEETVGVYLPMSYQIGGYTAFVPRSAIQRIDMSVEDAMRFVFSAGMSSGNGNVPHSRAQDEIPHSKSG